jgi:hypothetical protein
MFFLILAAHCQGYEPNVPGGDAAAEDDEASVPVGFGLPPSSLFPEKNENVLPFRLGSKSQTHNAENGPKMERWPVTTVDVHNLQLCGFRFDLTAYVPTLDCSTWLVSGSFHMFYHEQSGTLSVK